MTQILRQLIWRIYMLKPVRATSLYFLGKSWLFHRRGPRPDRQNDRFSIGIVTYIRRYQQFFRPLIVSLTTLFPDTEIIVAVNGYYDESEQDKYLADITAFLTRFPNVKVLPYREAQSLSKLWNQLIINSTAAKTLIMNDDLLILPWFRRQLESSELLGLDVGIIKWSWSHFILSKSVVARAGWFDERFPGVGNEDEDYEARLTILGIPVPIVMMGGLRNITVKTLDFSYGKDIAVVNEKYVSANKQFFESKWSVSPRPLEGFTYVRLMQNYVQLKPGMETPAFYPSICYDPA